jgi:hypothetical protein
VTTSRAYRLWCTAEKKNILNRHELGIVGESRELGITGGMEVTVTEDLEGEQEK